MNIRSIRLSNFRNVEYVVFEGFSKVNYIYGDNGVGKTNILDAVTRFSSSFGIKNQYAKYCTNVKYPQKGWGAHLLLEDKGGYEHLLTTGIPAGKKNRILKYDGKKTNQSKIDEFFSCLWLAPVEEKLFNEDAKQIRNYFNYMIGKFSTEFNEKYALYERVCKQRLQILTKEDIPIDKRWLDSLELQISTLAMELINIREGFISEFILIQKEYDDIFSKVFPKFQLSYLCQTQNISSLEQYIDTLKSYRPLDMNAKRTLFGIHRIKWKVKHIEKNIDIGFCSTGEQKSVLMAFLFLMNIMIFKISGITSLILLDDVYSHFDNKRVSFIGDYINSLDNMFFLSGTSFNNLNGDDLSQFEINNEIIT